MSGGILWGFWEKSYNSPTPLWGATFSSLSMGILSRDYGISLNSTNYFSYNLERFSREIPRYGWAHLPCWKNCMLTIAAANQSGCFSFSITNCSQNCTKSTQYGLQCTKSDDFTKHHSLPLSTTSHPLSPPSCLYFLSPFPPSVFFSPTPSFPLSLSPALEQWHETPSPLRWGKGTWPNVTASLLMYKICYCHNGKETAVLGREVMGKCFFIVEQISKQLNWP